MESWSQPAHGRSEKGPEVRTRLHVTTACRKVEKEIEKVEVHTVERKQQRAGSWA